METFYFKATCITESFSYWEELKYWLVTANLWSSLINSWQIQWWISHREHQLMELYHHRDNYCWMIFRRTVSYTTLIFYKIIPGQMIQNILMVFPFTKSKYRNWKSFCMLWCRIDEDLFPHTKRKFVTVDAHLN